MQSSFLITFYRSSCTVVNWKPCKVWWRVGLWILHAFGPRSVWKEPFGLTWIILSLSVLARALFRPCEIYNAKLSTASALKGKSKLGVLLWGVGSNPSRTPLSADYLHTTVEEKKINQSQIQLPNAEGRHFVHVLSNISCGSALPQACPRPFPSSACSFYTWTRTYETLERLACS